MPLDVAIYCCTFPALKEKLFELKKKEKDKAILLKISKIYIFFTLQEEPYTQTQKPLVTAFNGPKP